MAADTAVALCIPETDAVIVAVAVVAQTANAAAALPVEATVRT